MRIVFALLTLFLSLSVSAEQDLIDTLRAAETRLGLPDMSLVALSATESTLSWYALNFDDVASFYPKTKTHALQIIRSVSGRPYAVKIVKPNDAEEVYFFATRQAAQRAVSKARRINGYEVVTLRDDRVVKKIDLLNTGLCAMQLNFRWQAHGQGRTAEDLLDREFCIEHASNFVAGLINKHGFEKGVGCYYTCGNGPIAKRNRKEYFERYKRHLDRLTKSTSIAQR